MKTRKGGKCGQEMKLEVDHDDQEEIHREKQGHGGREQSDCLKNQMFKSICDPLLLVRTPRSGECGG